MIFSKTLRLETMPTSIGILGLLGAMPLGSAAALINLFLPLSSKLSLILLAPAFFVLPWRHLRVRQLAILSFVSLAVSIIALHQPPGVLGYDTGLYHLQGIIRSQLEPTIAGLANLHGRLAFNSIYYPLAAVLTLPGFEPVSPYILNGLLLTCLITALWESVKPGESNGGHQGAESCFPLHKLFNVIMLLLLLSSPRLFGIELISPSTDLPVITFIIGSSLLWMNPRKDSDSLHIFSISLAITAALCKLSATFFAGFLLMGIFYGARKDRRSIAKFRNFILLLALFTLPWLARGYLQSGCLAYPASATCLELHPWSIAKSQAQIMSKIILEWAQWDGPTPAHLTSSLEWIAPWFQRLTHQNIFILCIGATCSLALNTILRSWQKKRLSVFPEDSGELKTLIFAHLVSLAIWFKTAPATRFAYANIFVLCVIWTAAALDGFRSKLPLKLSQYAAVFAGVLLLGRTLWNVRNNETSLPERHLTKANTQTYLQMNEVELVTPLNGENCWDSRKLCSPEVRKNLLVTRDKFGRLFIVNPTPATSGI